MISIITDIFDSSYLNPVKSVNVEKTKQNKEATESDKETEVDLSKRSKKPINNIISKEDEISQKLSTAQNIYDMLGEIRLELAGLVKTLRSTDIEHDLTSLEELNIKSDSLIEKAINIVKSDNITGIATTDLTKNYLSGLSSVKELKLSGNEYITQLESILKNIKNEEDNYYELTKTLYSDMNALSSEYENLLTGTNKNGMTNTIKSEILQNDIIKKHKQTLSSTAKELSKDIVLNLL